MSDEIEKNKIKNMLKTQIALGIGGMIVKTLEDNIPKRELYLRGNWLKSFQKYRKSIDVDISALEKDKKSMSEQQYQQIKNTLEIELLEAECVFYFLQNKKYYITIPKKTIQ